MPAVGVAVGRGSNERTRAQRNFRFSCELGLHSFDRQVSFGYTVSFSSSVIQLGVHLSVHPRETRGRRMGMGIVTDHTHRNRAGGSDVPYEQIGSSVIHGNARDHVRRNLTARPEAL